MKIFKYLLIVILLSYISCGYKKPTVVRRPGGFISNAQLKIHLINDKTKEEITDYLAIVYVEYGTGVYVSPSPHSEEYSFYTLAFVADATDFERFPSYEEIFGQVFFIL